MKKGFLSSYTGILILINVVVFLLSFVFIGIMGEKFSELFALRPDLFFSGYVWTIFTSMFLHSNALIIHIIANMISLFFLGMFVERLIGKRRFLGFYLISGIFAGIFAATLAYFFGTRIPIESIFDIPFGIERVKFALFGSPSIFMVGASGAIFGILGLAAILTPKTKVYFLGGPVIALIIPFILSTLFGDHAWLTAWLTIIGFIVTIYFIFSIFAILSFNPELRKYALPVEISFKMIPIFAIGLFILVGFLIPLPIGNSAHLGGLLVGLVYGIYLRKKYPGKTRMIRSYFSR